MPPMRLTAGAERDLSAVPRSELPRVLAALDRLREDPAPGKRLHGEFGGRRSLRVGNYRILYRYSQGITTVTRIRRRADVYRQP
jgi:mRNA-degrading endonuclease RelE of RelBE toxin-antitoxin system